MEVKSYIALTAFREGRPGAKLSVDCNTQEAVHGSKVRSQVVRGGWCGSEWQPI